MIKITQRIIVVLSLVCCSQAISSTKNIDDPYAVKLDEASTLLGFKPFFIAKFKEAISLKKNKFDKTKGTPEEEVIEQCLLKGMKPERKYQEIIIDGLKEIYSKDEIDIALKALKSETAKTINNLYELASMQRKSPKKSLEEYVLNNKDAYDAYVKHTKTKLLNSEIKRIIGDRSKASLVNALEQCGNLLENGK